MVVGVILGHLECVENCSTDCIQDFCLSKIQFKFGVVGKICICVMYSTCSGNR